MTTTAQKKFEIKSWLDGRVCWAGEAVSWKHAIEQAIQSDADLTDANLTRANLTDANLTRANLTDANLTRANLTRANLTDANLTRANLTDADLTRANLTDADLTHANLTDADLTRANLTDANLTDADLTDANLTDANLTDADLTRANLTDANLTDADLTDADLTRANLTVIRDDIWAILSAQPKEVQFLRDAIAAGIIDGSCYTGQCACLVGTIAKACALDVNSLAVKPNSDRAAERFFMGIKPGDTPATNPVSKLALEWVDTWLANMRAAFSVVQP